MYEEALARVRGQAGNSLFISLRILRNCVSSRWSSSSRKTVQRLRSSLTVIMTKALEDGHAQFVARSAEDLTLTWVSLTQWRRGPWGSAWAPADPTLGIHRQKNVKKGLRVKVRPKIMESTATQEPSVLHAAVYEGDVETATWWLLQHPTHLHLLDVDGQSLLHLAGAGGKSFALHSRSLHHHLTAAVRRNNLEMVRMLLAAGFDVNCRDADNWTAGQLVESCPLLRC